LEPVPASEKPLPTARESMRSLGFEGDALLGEVEAAMNTLRALLDHSELLGEEVVTALRLTLAQVSSRLRRSELAVVVAGERGSGKRTFLDALIGDRRLGAALGRTRITTSLRRRATPRYRARLVDGKMEDFARLVPDRQRQMDERLVAREAKFAEAESNHAAAVSRAERATAAREKQAAELDATASDLGGALEVVTSFGATLASTEMASDQSSKTFQSIERELPRALVVARPAVTLWARFWHAVLRFFFRARWNLYLDTRQKRDHAQERLEALRERVRVANDARIEIEARVMPLREALQAAARAEEESLTEVKRAQKELEGAQKELEELKKAVGRYVEERMTRFFAELKKLSDGSRDNDVLELAIDYPATLLPDDVAVIDAPGVTNEATARAWNLVREEADGCILVSELDRGVSGPTADFLERVRGIVPHVLLVLTKMDAAFVDALRRGSQDPWNDVEHARRIGTRRFARQIGRSQEEVLSIAVSAQAALEDPESKLGQGFEGELAKLFRVLRHERALILGTRAASAVRRCIAETRDAEKRATEAYHTRIEALEAERAPDPEVFHRQKVADAEAGIADMVRLSLSAAGTTAEARFDELREREATGIRHDVWRRPLSELGAREKNLETEFEKLRRDVTLELEARSEACVSELELSIFAELGQRYRLTRPVQGSRASFHLLGLDPPKIPLRIGLDDAVTRHRQLKLVISAVGLVLGCIVGALIGSFLGAAIGALLGALAGLGRTKGSLERRALRLTEARLNQEREVILRWIGALDAGIQTSTRAALDRSIEDAIVRFGRDMAEPIEADQKAMARERSNLGRLRELGEALAGHDTRLVALMTAAADASSGLCR
jgi:hypothetical protein